jgi:mono/diheme cytochrome c family protein
MEMVSKQVGGLVLLLSCLLSLTLAGCNTAEAEQSPVAQGKELFTKFGCISCHAVSKDEVEKKVGPPLAGAFGQSVRLSDGRVVTVDDAYVRQSIREPDAATVDGYPVGVMATGLAPYKARLQEPATLDALVEYVKSLK